MFNEQLNAMKALTPAKAMAYGARLWKRTFPFLVGILFIASALYVGVTGYNALYKSDLSANDRALKARAEQRKNSFQEDQFNALLVDIKQRQENTDKRSETVVDIFYEADIARE